MNDRLRFRAFDKKKNTMLKPLNGMALHMFFEDQDRFIIEQSTGLYDKKGRLIYENDVVNWRQQSGGVLPPDGEYKAIIKWDEYQFKCQRVDKDRCLMFQPHLMEIIGNIHEQELKG